MEKKLKYTSISLLALTIINTFWTVFGLVTEMTDETNPTFAMAWRYSTTAGWLLAGVLILLALIFSIKYLSNKEAVTQGGLMEWLSNLYISAPIALILVVATFPFMIDATNMDFGQRFASGGANLQRIVIVYGVYVLLSWLFLRGKRLVKVSYLLGVSWLAGTLIVIVMNIYQPNNYLCARPHPYDNPPEFERSLSLIEQRKGIERGIYYKNCLKISYEDLIGTGISGYFIFDTTSDGQELTIKVDKSYSAKDDLLTAILLSHELLHVEQFIELLDGGEEQSCYEQEVAAFSSMLGMLNSLNKEEWQSLVTRIRDYIDLNGQSETAYISGGDYESIFNLLALSDQAALQCKETHITGTDGYNVCYWNAVKDILREAIENDPGYIEQCLANQI